MPISSITNTSVAIVPQRGKAEHLVREQGSTKGEGNNSGTQLERNPAGREPTGLLPQQRVPTEARGSSPDLRHRPQFDQENLNFTARKALQAFADNTPSPEQQLGIELAGIDTYA